MPQNKQNPNYLDTLTTMFSAFDLSKEERRLINHLDNLLRKQNVKRVMLIGGIVRDLYIGNPRKPNSLIDIDLIVEGDVLKAKTILFEVYPEASWIEQPNLHTLRGSMQNLKIDIASARKERYQYPGAFPTLIDLCSIEEDEIRRDFTVNSLRLPLPLPVDGDLKSLIVGSDQALSDITAKTLRIYHDHSFADDPLRVIRAARYSARFGFSIAPETISKISTAALGLKNISNNRVRNELELLFSESSPTWLKATARLIEWKFFNLLQYPVNFQISSIEAEELLSKLDNLEIQSSFLEQSKQIEPWQRKFLVSLGLAVKSKNLFEIVDFMKWLGGCGNLVHDLGSLHTGDWRSFINLQNMTKLILYFLLFNSINEDPELIDFMSRGYNAVPRVRFRDFDERFTESHDIRKCIQELWLVKFLQPELGITTKLDELAWINKHYLEDK